MGPDATFATEELMLVYLEVYGFQNKPVIGGYEIWVELTNLKFTDPNGKVIADQPNVIEFHQTVDDESSDIVWFRLPLGYAEEGDPTGEYILEIEVTDKTNGEKDTVTTFLYVE
jgi:hypothetical protein